MIWSKPLVYYLMSGTSSVVNDTSTYGFQLPAKAISLQQIGRETYFPFERQTLKRNKRNDNSLERRINNAVSSEAKDFAKSYQRVVRPVLRAKIKAEEEKKKAEEEKKKAEKEKEKLMLKVNNLEHELDALKLQNLDLKAVAWKVAPRVFFDDIEAKYKPQYDKYKSKLKKDEEQHKLAHATLKVSKGSKKPPYVPKHTTSGDLPDARDPKAVRIRQKADFFYWLFEHRPSKEDVKPIIQKLEAKFRSMNKIAVNQELTIQQKRQFGRFKKRSCMAVGYASEMASFIIHGNQILALFKGELEEMNIYGEAVDPYLVPILNALVPMTKKGEDFVKFKDIRK